MESVDRNILGALKKKPTKESLSVWRAWIEIHFPAEGVQQNRVALRMESVDRNFAEQAKGCVREIVALRMESVDRNILNELNKALGTGRSPYGERG